MLKQSFFNDIFTTYHVRTPSPSGVGTSVNTSSTVTRPRKRSVLTGENYRDWKDQIKRVQAGTTNLLGYKIDQRLNSASLTVISSVGWKETSVGPLEKLVLPVYSGAPIASTLLTTAEAQAKSRLLTSYNSATRKFSAGTFVGEMGEALLMLKSPVKRLRAEIQDIDRTIRNIPRKYSRDTWSRRLEAATDTWLTWSFGAKPLFSDAKSAAEAVAAAQVDSVYPQSIRVRGDGLAESSVNNARQTFSVYPGFSPGMRSDSRTDSKVTVRYTGAVKWGSELGIGPRLELFGISPEDFLPTAYNLIPYSWLLDYFANVGEVIDSSKFLWMKFGWLQKTERVELTRVFTRLGHALEGTVSNTQVYLSGGGNGGYSRTSSVFREKMDAMTTIDLTSQIPGLGTKWLNMAALANGFEQTRKAWKH